jgi:hypothetical protein
MKKANSVVLLLFLVGMYAQQGINYKTLIKDNLGALVANEVLAVRSADYNMLSLLREKVETILQTNSEFYDKQFIETVLKDYNYYTQSM